MRAILFIFWCTLPATSLSQSSNEFNEPPVEIQHYYKKLNFINSFSTTSEESRLVKYLEKGDPDHAPTSKREFFVMNLLQDVHAQELELKSPIPNKFEDGLTKSKVFYEITDCSGADGNVKVTVKTYQISFEDNIKMIKLFDEEKMDRNEGIISLLSNPSLISSEIHHWVLIDNQWLKKKVAVVLTE
jgi:hypothetical protein